MNGLGNHLDALSGHNSLISIGIDEDAADHAPDIFRTAQKNEPQLTVQMLSSNLQVGDAMQW